MRVIEGATILCQSGSYFDFKDLSANPVSIRDIAHGLSNQCRFTGQTRGFYSVAEHSVLASHIVPHTHAMAALLHDAHEAFVGDVAAPLKQLLPDYAALEARVQAEVLSRFDIALPLPEAVKRADLQMLRREQLTVMQNDDAWSGLEGISRADVLIEFLTPGEARARFLARFRELGGAL